MYGAKRSHRNVIEQNMLDVIITDDHVDHEYTVAFSNALNSTIPNIECPAAKSTSCAKETDTMDAERYQRRGSSQTRR